MYHFSTSIFLKHSVSYIRNRSFGRNRYKSRTYLCIWSSVLRYFRWNFAGHQKSTDSPTTSASYWFTDVLKVVRVRAQNQAESDLRQESRWVAKDLSKRKKERKREIAKFEFSHMSPSIISLLSSDLLIGNVIFSSRQSDLLIGNVIFSWR